MATVGTNNFIDRELTAEEFASIGFPAFYVLKNEQKKIIKIIAFDGSGVRSDVAFDHPDFSVYATQLGLDAEIVNRAIADTNLQTQVNNEIGNRTAGDISLQTKIDAEIVNRAAADSNLQGQVNAINGRTSSLVDKMLHYWDSTAGKWLSSGMAYVSGRIGIGTTTPAEQLDVNGRVRAKSVVLPANVDAGIPNELGSDGTRPYFGANKRGIAFNDEKVNIPSTNGTFAIQKSGSDVSFVPTFSSLENLFFEQNGKWAFPNSGVTTYSTLRTGVIIQIGQSARTSSLFIPIIDYTFSSGTSIAYRRGSPLIFTYSKTFKFIQQFDINSLVATTRLLVGLSSMFGTANPNNVSADTLVRTVGICKISSGANLSWVWNDATGAANIEDMGSGFPANDFNSIYRLTIDSTTAGVSVTMRLERINKTTGAITSATKIITSDFLIESTFFLYPILYCCDSAATGTGSIGDYGIIGYINLI